MTATPDPAEIDKYRALCAGMVVDALEDESHEVRIGIVNHVMFGEPIPAEYD